MRRRLLAFMVLVVGCVVTLACVGDDPVPVSAPEPSDAGARFPPGVPPLPREKLVWLLSGSADVARAFEADERCTDDLRKTRNTTAVDAIGWIVAGGRSPLERLGAATGPWVVRSGKIVFSTRDDLLTGPAAAIDLDLAGRDKSGFVWTGLLPDASPSGFDCDSWRDPISDAGATVGKIGLTGAAWVTFGVESCIQNDGAILCIER